MKSIWTIAGVALMGLALTGCFDGGSSNRSAGPSPRVDFTTFVKGEINNTADNREAARINNVEFSFNDQNNEQAYDDLF